ncbi:MAG TPA: branched-chain amino acid ABC transporter permease [Ensifer sp.]|nr:branched-chain amino acid ABC transporter permease [Ensifer sp.]
MFPILAMKILIMAIFAMGYNIIFGYGGLLAFGHAAFFGTASYIAAHMAAVWGVPPEFCLLAGVAGSSVLGLLFGWLAIRRQGLYFAMITLALAQIVYFYAVQASWTHGEDGIQSVPRGVFLGLVDLSRPLGMYFTILAFFLAAFVFVYRVVHSPFGQTLKSIRESEQRSVSLGYSVNNFKLIAFVLSAALAGLAGGLNAIVFQIASLSDVYFMNSANALLMTLIGGVGTLLGPIVGAAVLVTLETRLATFGSWVVVMQGLIFVLCVLFLRKGIIGTLQEYASNRRIRRNLEAQAATQTPGKPAEVAP